MRRLSDWVTDDVAKQARWYDSPGGPLKRGRDLAAAAYESGRVLAWADATEGDDKGYAVREVYRGTSKDEADAVLAKLSSVGGEG